MNRLLTTLLTALCWLSTFAIPARRTPFTVWQSDSTALTVTMIGDETFHFLATLDGTPVVEDGEGFFRLAPELKEEMSAKWTQKLAKRNATRLAKARGKAEAMRKEFGKPTTYVGKARGLVLLVNFANQAMKSANTQTAWNNQFNQQGYDKNHCSGSVHDYFYDQSYGKFDIEFDVVGPLTLSKEYAYYGKYDDEGDDTHPCEMVIEACKLANQEDIDFTQYDWDKDGEVDMVYVVYAGTGEHASGETNRIWPHEWELSSGALYGDGTGVLTLDGVKIDNYAVSCELRGSKGSTMDGIGTACHEFSHGLGLPDTYDTSYSGGFGMNAWDVLDAGSYNGATGYGETPAGFTAYERNFVGWLNYTELTEPCDVVDMPALQDTAVAYIVRNSNHWNEYFILENRQNRGWFQYAGDSQEAHGMLIYHVDYDLYAWQNNEVNSEAKHQRMSIIPAGKTYGRYYSSSGQYSPSASQLNTQLFPGTKNVTELTNTSHEDYNAKLFHVNKDGSYYMNKPITDITEENGLISFKFMGGGTNAVTGINLDNEDKTEYFTLSGTKVAEPKQRGIYLMRQNGVARKIFIR